MVKNIRKRIHILTTFICTLQRYAESPNTDLYPKHFQPTVSTRRKTLESTTISNHPLSLPFPTPLPQTLLARATLSPIPLHNPKNPSFRFSPIQQTLSTELFPKLSRTRKTSRSVTLLEARHALTYKPSLMARQWEASKISAIRWADAKSGAGEGSGWEWKAEPHYATKGKGPMAVMQRQKATGCGAAVGFAMEGFSRGSAMSDGRAWGAGDGEGGVFTWWIGYESDVSGEGFFE